MNYQVDEMYGKFYKIHTPRGLNSIYYVCGQSTFDSDHAILIGFDNINNKFLLRLTYSQLRDGKVLENEEESNAIKTLIDKLFSGELENMEIADKWMI